IAGGTGNDHVYGGRGSDLLNVDDDQDTYGGVNNGPDTDASYEDKAYGGAGRDVLIGNTGGDRLIDWVGEFNSYIVPYAPFGAFSVSRTLQPQLMDFLYNLSESDGADPTRADDSGADPARNGEPEGEMGLVKQKDTDWQDQTGAPDDPQAGNIPGGKRDVLRSATFNSGTMEAFAPDSGIWEVSKGSLQVSAESTEDDAVSVFFVDETLPSYYEVMATVNAGKPTAGWKSNGFIIFDYQSPTDFKFAGINVSIDKIQMGRRTAEGWIVDVQTKAKLKPETNYNLLLAVNGTNATLVVDAQSVFSYTFAPRVIDGYAFNLNTGMVGIGSDNSKGSFDNVIVQKLPPEKAFELTDNFDGSSAIVKARTGNWTLSGDRLYGEAASADSPAIAVVPLSIAALSYLEVHSTVNTNQIAGFVFDFYNRMDFKFVAVSAQDSQVVIGHRTDKGWFVDATADLTIKAGKDYELGIALKGTTVSATLDGQAAGGHVYNSLLSDGSLGLMSNAGASIFDDLWIWGDDQTYVFTG
ncbi:MAG: hypothetical protein KAH12_11420, partial [Anaerolineales bacterium]|nr:hypothetical protein [Anaerolineales bacterium]